MADKVIISNKYYIKRDGKVYRISDDSEFIPCLRNGYYVIYTSDKKAELLSRVVAKAFIPNPESKPEVDHINRVKTDNRVENLRWVTRKENMNNIARNRPLGHRFSDMTPSEYVKSYRSSESYKKQRREKLRQRYKTDPIFKYKMVNNVRQYRLRQLKLAFRRLIIKTWGWDIDKI